MYYLYDKSSPNKLRKIQEISLVGCNSGIIPKILIKRLKDLKLTLPGWNLDFSSEEEYENKTIIIDYKPKKINEEASICELLDVYGYNYDNWTPIMLRLKEFNFVIPNKDIIDYRDCNNSTIIYTFLYLNGFIKDNELCGTWSFPSPSPTNSLMLYRDAFNYFIGKILEKDKNYFSVLNNKL